MGWKDWNAYQKGILICFLIIVIAFLPFVEYKLRLNTCEPIPNLGGPNEPYCTTMFFSLLLIPGFFIDTLILLRGGGDVTLMHWVLIGFFSFIIYSLICALGIWVYGKIRSK